ncbi:MAG: PilZ domain-containing protein [Sphingomicrobium sp.]|nr:hypothetical protein [Sphingomonadales bacterium]
MEFGLSGGMIPRKVKRLFDERREPRLEPQQGTAVLGWRRREAHVALCNVSSFGAMIQFDEIPHIGERVTLQLIDHGAIAGQVRWVRDGHVGINFAAPLK